MKIPKKFKLFGQEIKVVFDNELQLKEDHVGLANYRKNLIILDNNVTREQSQIEQTFLHELIHFICEELGENELQKNEKLVDLIANLLHQAFETMEYR
jgi:Zn-dependent peptidase ImmA (M78 family)